MDEKIIDIDKTGLLSDPSDGYDFASIERISFYFGPEEKPLFGCLHHVPHLKNTNTAILICPSIGVEYMNAFRPLRYVADYHALEGIPALRLDYHGTGDSSGVNDEPKRIKEWLWSIECACQKLKELTGCERIILFGLRVGGTLATLAAESVDVNDLVLWAPIEDGRRYIREIKALQMTASNQNKETDVLEAGGAVFSQETISELIKIKLAKCSPKIERALIVPRDDLPVNEKLKEAWLSKGLTTAQFRYDGYADMVVDAHHVKIPHNTIQKIVIWSKQLAKPASSTIVLNDENNKTRVSCYNACAGEYSQNSDFIGEEIILYGAKNNRIAILSSPTKMVDNNKPIIILANSGANHRVGPNRLYVLLARELSRKGFQCLRIDINGLGDSVLDDPAAENVVYIHNPSQEIELAMKSLGEKHENSKFIVMGLCSGAYFSFHAALDLMKSKIVECVLINPLTFYWEEGMSLDVSPTQNFRDWNWYKSALKSPSSWIKLIKGKIAFSALFKTLVRRVGVVISSKVNQAVASSGNNKNNTEKTKVLSQDLMNISGRDVQLSIFLSRTDPGYDILMTSAGKVAKKLIKNGKIRLTFIEDADHTFSRLEPRCFLINSLTRQLEKRYRDLK